jgi:xylan 1,4-beta-xylosidase
MFKNYLVLMLLLLILISGNKSLAQKKNYTNPILAGFFPDPSICRVDDNYYLANSTFSYFPGLPVFQSKDLVNWRQIGNAMDDSDIMKLDGLQVSEGMFAPAIRYNKGTYYVTCTFVGGNGNFVVKSKSPGGPYSKPVWITEINGIDPTLFFDENGKTYIIYNSVAPDNKELYRGHRTIRIREFDIKNLKVVGEEHLLINGGTDLSKKPIWIEGPHLYQKDGYYYLLASEGGTREDHSVVIFRSKDIFGPYECFKNNPILTHRNLDPKRNNPITCTGHADFVQTPKGDWYSVFLGSRPYAPFEKNHFNTGRETFLVPVKWVDGWPVINPGKNEVQYTYPLPLKPNAPKGIIPQSGNFKIKDDFNNKNLDLNWIFLRTPKTKWYSIDKKKSYLSLQLRPETCYEKVNPSFIGRRQQHLYGSSSVKIDFTPKAENEKAGLIIFQNENHFYFLCKSIEKNNPVIQLFKSSDSAVSNNHLELIASQIITKKENKKNLFLKIEARANVYDFFYACKPSRWKILKDNVDGIFLSTETAGGFCGCLYALYATSLGKECGNTANYDWFEYEGNDKIY